MPDEDIQKKLAELDEKITAIHTSVEKTRKYFLTTLIVSVVLFVVPLIGLLFAIPSFLSTYSNIDSLGL